MPVRVLEARFETDPSKPLISRAPGPAELRES
jgi:hypothetical protein